MPRLGITKKFIVIVLISLVGFCVYWFWPQSSVSTIVDEGQHINQETRKVIEESNAKSQIKTRYIIYNETDVPLSSKAQFLTLDQKQDVFYVLMKPLGNNLFRDINSTSYVQASPTLETKLVDKHPNLTNIIGPSIYGQNYDEAVIKSYKQLRIATRFVEDEAHKNHYDSIIKILFVLFVILSFVAVLLSIFTNDDDDHNDDSSNDENNMLATTNMMLASTIITNMH